MASQQTSRLDLRLDVDRKRLIEQAASLLGQSVSAFTVSSAVREACEVVQHFGVLSLSDRDRDDFLVAIDNPPKPNARLRRAFRTHGEEASK